ncbi:hypothetical protein FE633_28400 [Streptomyces montanus]|uniref:Uncharacterized protein n=1 Tax=Streptomyces montanus TaxID=2580423 RepID=A0A5R9FK46_9ACTN|nr:hypothetical protein [Streptomyces montanus]TLS42919.1 hypothetical protein FE633_28400 [Streptomyces montanus]
MTNTSNERPSPQGSLFRAAPLPEAPGAPTSSADRVTLLRAQADALNALVREDLSRGRSAVFLLCAVVLTAVCALVPVVMIDVATSKDGNDATDVAVAGVLACLLLALLALPALLVLRRLRVRGVQRRRLMEQWAAVDRGYDSEFPSVYGSQGYPHARFFNACLVLTLVLILVIAVLADTSDPSVLAMLPGLAAAGFLAWAPIKKYADRFSWSSREQVIRGRERRRQKHREQVNATPTAQVFLAFGLPRFLLRRRRDRATLAEAALPLAAAFGSGTSVYPIRYGLNEVTDQVSVAGPAAWDRGPVRMGALVQEGDTLRLRGTDGTALDLPLAQLLGAAFIANTVAWLDPTVDLLLHSGEAIEVRTSDARVLADALSSAGVRTVSA